MKISKFFWLLLLAGLTGCGSFPLRPGRAQFSTPDGVSGSVHQSQNPQAATTQVYKRTITEPGPGNAVQSGSRVTSETIETTIGPAQKDTAREIGAKLSSLRPVVYVGILVFLFGAASFVYPPLKIITGGSVTTSAVITGSGLAMIILPSLVVGNEILIMAVAAGAAALWFFAHRHGTLRGTVEALKEQVKK